MGGAGCGGGGYTPHRAQGDWLAPQRRRGHQHADDGGGGGGVRAAGLWRGCRGRGAVWRERVARGSRHGPGIVGHGCGARAEAGEGEEARVPGEGGSRRGHRGRRGCPGQAGR